MKGGYHLTDIPKGKVGEWSKVEEELAEYEDAKIQGSKIMMACELADAYGALNAYYKVKDGVENETVFKNTFQYVLDEAAKLNLGYYDLLTFSQITERAFKIGERGY